MSHDADDLFELLGLGEYEETALAELLTVGQTTAPDLAEATGIPKARIYGVLDDLADAGYVKVIPGRPKRYQPKAPEEILSTAVENRRQSFESFRSELDEVREAFTEQYGPLYESASSDVTPTEELFYVVDVGEPSERETRKLYRDATDCVNVITKSFAYLDSVSPAIADAREAGVDMRVVFLHPDQLSAENRERQAELLETFADRFPGVEYRFSPEPLPWRGTFADPSMEYDSGRALLLVEEKDVPLSMRQAAVTENGSFVAGLSRYFDMLWEYETVAPDR
ncbi:TrmB family transcriptional regulator [Halobaculum sp. D14]|uniref:TrmB family transcriptional regulator n=1 Tax=Halobaculum sp. D14 TaxID=3421642 RepID=UPI003EBA4741